MADVEGGAQETKPTPEGAKNGAIPVQDAPKSLTQDEVNRLLHNEREKLEAKFEAKFAQFRSEVSPKLTELEAVKQAHAELKKLIEENTKEVPEPDDDSDPIALMLRSLEPPTWIKTDEGRRTWMRERRKDLLRQEADEARTTQLKAAEERIEKLTRESEERAKREAESARNALAADRQAKVSRLIASLPIPKTPDAEDAVESWLDRRVKRDENTGKLLFASREDEFLPLTVENVDKFLPAILRAPANTEGGSGGGQQTVRQAPSQETITSLEAQYQKAVEAAAKEPRNDTRAAEVMRLKREIAQARKSQAA